MARAYLAVTRLLPAAHLTERRAVEFTAEPGSRLWMAVCLALGGAILFGCFLLGLGELFAALKREVFQAIIKVP